MTPDPLAAPTDGASADRVPAIALDAGQTGIKARTTGTPRDAVHPGIRTDAPLLPQLAAVVRAELERTDVAIEVVAAGVSGLTDAEADADALRQLLADTGIARVVMAHDSTTSFLGALGDGQGVVVAAGTGVVTLAVGPTDVARVDGWGYLMGDAGSGYWIGREALDAVMRAYDGRGAPTALTDAVRAQWPHLPDAYIDLQSDPGKVGVVAAFAEPVARAALEGDGVAISISRRAAAELAASAAAALRRTGQADASAEVCAIGGVFGSPVLREAFETAATAAGFRLVPPRGHGIDGVERLVHLSPQHPLAASVRRSTTA
ncbi:BadF/BadG/BcrA/BcrD ATPase family protein [Microbacterium sp. 1P10UB]|uniref:BadF/BadG/BcrA/BcrD ATPase family protein n=1 Tax=unclassified Microbacterium TaxID=2609290 RepID=UPI0039A2CBCE